MTQLLILAAVAAVATPAVLTGLGSRRRGASWGRAILSGLLFPLTWVAWYVRDEPATAHYRRG